MDGSTETLLVILISILSALAIVSLVAFITLLVMINKLVNKLRAAGDSATETLSMIRHKMSKPAGLFVAARYVYKIIRQKK